jgi:hypothetical protein
VLSGSVPRPDSGSTPSRSARDHDSEITARAGPGRASPAGAASRAAASLADPAGPTGG